MKNLWWPGSALIFMCFSIFLYNTNKQKDKTEQESIQRQKQHFPEKVDVNRLYRGWDFEKKQWRTTETYIPRPNHNLNDIDLQELRERMEYDPEGRYFHIPGKRVVTREQEIQEGIDRYIEDNIDDIIDEYAN